MSQTRSAPSESSAAALQVNPHLKRVVLAHGGGGQLTSELITEVIRPRLSNVVLDVFDDSAVLALPGEQMALSTDSYVVQPLEFPGGDIGRLAVSGTVNDLAVCGAVPKYLTLGLILEEGFELEVLKRILDSIATTAEEAGVAIVTGDTKVVARGQADQIYINTAGIGAVRGDCDLGVKRIEPGDCVIVSGTMADHGLAVMLQREDAFGIESDLKSDAAPLAGMIGEVLDAHGARVVFMRDPTRGGLAGVVADLAEESGWHLTIDETRIPIRHETNYAAEILGLDPLDVANEGKVVLVVRPDVCERVLGILRSHPLGTHAECVGTLVDQRDGLCELITDVGGRRIIQKPYGEELPRIC